jgi:bifunctional DNA-binding transcriptional regulator/antitoxin component of YhaV-PrlF toxin-antitoxin module
VEKLPQLKQVQKVLGGNRVTIFNEACKRLGITKGSFVIVCLEEDGLKIVPAEVKPKKTSTKKGD